MKYIKDLSQKVLRKEIELNNIDKLSNNEVITQLTNVKESTYTQIEVIIRNHVLPTFGHKKS
ncbi:hypothetical protein [Bacillus altitudinis]|uniref:hypothetical protein n=1 Tax=Bacillus altitudinis TaxID=293387 RepID=UPI0032ED1CBB